MLPSRSKNWGAVAVRTIDYADAASASRGVAAESSAIADAASAIAAIGAATITNNFHIWGKATKSDKLTIQHRRIEI